MKILTLIIASDNHEVYIELQKLWKLQFNAHPDITCYFLKANPNLEKDIEIHEDTIWVKYPENFYDGILFKTIKAIKHLSSSYDYVLRSNLSSFYVFENLAKTLEKFPRNNCYAGILGHTTDKSPSNFFVSGCGFILSKDICESLPSDPLSIWSLEQPCDDVCLGKYILSKFPYSHINLPRIDIHSPNDTITYPPDAIHYRIKTADHDYTIRAKNDFIIRKKLLTHFYPNLTKETNNIKQMELLVEFTKAYLTPSDINEHVETLRKYASKCNSVAEFGVRGGVSTCGILYGLSQSKSPQKSYIGVDINDCEIVGHMSRLAAESDIKYNFIKANSATVDIQPVDMLFIDSWHVYGHLKRELNKNHTKVAKYIIMHDTTVDEFYGESLRCGWDTKQQSLNSGYPEDEIRKGLYPAITEFLQQHPEWELEQKYTNCNGLTILRKKEPTE